MIKNSSSNLCYRTFIKLSLLLSLRLVRYRLRPKVKQLFWKLISKVIFSFKTTIGSEDQRRLQVISPRNKYQGGLIKKSVAHKTETQELMNLEEQIKRPKMFRQRQIFLRERYADTMIQRNRKMSLKRELNKDIGGVIKYQEDEEDIGVKGQRIAVS